MKIYPKSQDNRVAEVDFLRGIAIICMVVFHWYYLLDIKTGSSTTSTALIGGMGQIARVLFIFLVGVSVALSKQKSVEKKEDKEKYLRRQGKRVSVFVWVWIFGNFGDDVFLSGPVCSFWYFTVYGVCVIVVEFV